MQIEPTDDMQIEIIDDPVTSRRMESPGAVTAQSVFATNMPSRVVVDYLHTKGLEFRGKNQTIEAHDAMHQFVTSATYMRMQYKSGLLADARVDAEAYCLPFTHQMKMADAGGDLTRQV
jgi:hypothetical protein